MPKRTIGYFIQRHSRARKLVREAFWRLNDRPSALRFGIQIHDLYSAGGPTWKLFGGPICSHERLDEAVANYIEYCRQRRKWSYYHEGTPPHVAGKPSTCLKFTAASRDEFLERVKGHKARLDKALADADAKDEQSGHTAALLAYDKARRAEAAAVRDMEQFLFSRASISEVGRYANYVQAAVNTDFDFHLTELTKRADAKPSPVPVPTFERILTIATRHRDGALGTVAHAMQRLARSRRK